MRIGLSLVNFNPGRMGGVEGYFRNLLETLQRIDRDNEYLLLCDERSLGYFPLHQKNFRQHLIRSRKPLPYRWCVSLARRVSGVDIRKFAIDALELDVVHHPFNVMSPRQSGTPVVLTLHDVQHEVFPDFFGERGYQKRRAGAIGSLAAAQEVITDSEYSKKGIVEHYGVTPEKVTVIYLGKDPRFQQEQDQALMAGVKEKYGLARPFMYYPAASWPHKNHARLLRALSLLVERHGFDGELVMTGIAQQAQGEIERLAGELGLKERIRMLGYLETRELPALYGLARMLVFPSLFEGFGIPLVEAMSSGCPIACSNAASIPEVVGDAALLFEPTDPEEMAEAVWRVWSDEELRRELVQKSQQQVGLFDWESAARQTLEVYRRAAQGKGN